MRIAGSAPGADKAAGTVRLAELLGALSFALDLTEGQPIGHCARSAWIGLEIGRRMGLAEAELRELYYTVLLKDLGCSSNAARICELYLADDLAFKRDFKTMGTGLPKVLGFVLSQTGRGSPLGERLRAVLHIVRNGDAVAGELFHTRCDRGAAIATALRFPESVSAGIRALDEHWDGGGRPLGLRGARIPVQARIALLAQIVEVFHQAAGPAAALEEARSRAGAWFDPAVVSALDEVAAEPAFFRALSDPDLPERVFAMDHGRDPVSVDEDYLDDIARAFAQIVDAKSPFTSGHSERVSIYADLVAAELGHTQAHRRWLRRAALLHDLGKLGVSNAVLDKNGKLDEAEWREVRAHAELSERILARVPAFSRMARIGGAHHERLDGLGYPRGLSGDAIDLDTRIVSVADVFDALTADRPYRKAMPVAEALALMHRDSGTAFDPACLQALERVATRLEADIARVA